jgi:hypothetical protein
MGSLSFGKTVIDEPKVVISLKDKKSEPAVKSYYTPAVNEKVKPAPVAVPVKKAELGLKKIDLVVKDGSLKVTDALEKSVEISNINSSLNLRPPGEQTEFGIDATVSDEGRETKVSAAGRLKPKKKEGWSLKGASGDLTVEVNDLDLGSLGPIFELAGIKIDAKGSVSTSLKGEIKDGGFEKLSGVVAGRGLDISGPELKGDRFRSEQLDIGVELQRKKDLINLQKLRVEADWLKADMSGALPMTAKSLAEFMKPDSAYSLSGNFECDLAAVLSQMPQTFGVKEGTAITSGRLSGDIETTTQEGKRLISGQASIAGLEGIVGGRQVALSQPIRTIAKITSEKKGFRFEQLEVSASFAQVSLTGSSELLNYKADADLAQLKAELGQFVDTGPYGIAGQLHSEGQVSTNKDEIKAVGSSLVKELRISSTTGVSAFEPKAELEFSATVKQDKDLLEVDYLRADASFGRLGISDGVLGLDESAKEPMKMVVSAKEIDLGKLRPFLVLAGALPEQMQMSGVGESEISISSEKGVHRIVADSTRIRDLRLLWPGREPFVQDEISLFTDAQFNPDKKTYAVEYRVTSPQINIEGRLKKTTGEEKSKLEGEANLDYDWAAVSAMAGAYLPEGMKIEGKRKDSISFSSEYPNGREEELPANLDTKGRFGFARAEYMGLNFGPTEVDIKVDKGLLTIAPFSTTVNEGKLNFAADVKLGQKPMLLETPGPMQIVEKVNINEEVSRKLLVNLNPVFKDQADATGVVNFHAEKLAIPLGADGENKAEMVGTVSIDDMKLSTHGLLGQIMSRGGARSQMEGEVLPTEFVLRDGRLSYDDMQMNLERHPINFAGSIGPFRRLSMQVVTPYVLTDDFDFETTEVGQVPVSKRVMLPLKGTVDNPELDWDRFTEEFLQRQGEKLIQRGLEELLK